MHQTHSYFDRKVNLKTFTTLEGEKNLVRNHIKLGLKCCTICRDEMWFYRDNIFVKKVPPQCASLTGGLTPWMKLKSESKCHAPHFSLDFPSKVT